MTTHRLTPLQGDHDRILDPGGAGKTEIAARRAPAFAGTRAGLPT